MTTLSETEPLKTVILAGGMGTRLSDGSDPMPKPMVDIGGSPILVHVMEIYASCGWSEFVVAVGYRGEAIKRYFSDRNRLFGHLSIHLGEGKIERHSQPERDWLVHLVDTGLETQTGGRLRRLREWVGDRTFFMTYGDGLADIDIASLLEFHRGHGKLATVTAVRPPARFGRMNLEGDRVESFEEKPQSGEGWINGGFFVLEPAVLDLIDADDMPFERDPLERLAKDDEIRAFRHDGFWQCMDTPRDLSRLRELWTAGSPPWMRRRAD